MPSTKIERLLAAVGLAAIAALAAVAFFSVSDYVKAAESDREPVLSGPATTELAMEAASQPIATESAPDETETTPTVARPAVATRAELELIAARGDCWLEVRSGSADGESLFAGVLTQGDSRSFSAPSLWVRVGAGESLDATLNGDAVAGVPAGASTLSVTPQGVETLSLG